MLRTRFSGLGLSTRFLPIVGLFAAVALTAPAMASGRNPNPGAAAPAVALPASATFTASSPGLLSVKQTLVTAATAGAVSAITLEVTNNTLAPATGVFLGAELPAGAHIAALPTPNLCARGLAAGPAFACYVGTVAPGATSSLTFQAVLSGAPGTELAAATGFANGAFTVTVSDLLIP